MSTQHELRSATITGFAAVVTVIAVAATLWALFGSIIAFVGYVFVGVAVSLIDRFGVPTGAKVIVWAIAALLLLVLVFGDIASLPIDGESGHG